MLLRAWNDHATPDVFDLYPYASTTPVYVQVGNTKVRSKEDADYFLAWIAKAKAAAAANHDYNTPAERKAVMGHIEKAQRIFEKRLAEAGTLIPPQTGAGAGSRIFGCAPALRTFKRLFVCDRRRWCRASEPSSCPAHPDG